MCNSVESDPVWRSALTSHLKPNDEIQNRNMISAKQREILSVYKHACVNTERMNAITFKACRDEGEK